jgi:hypothetical protein
MQQPYAYGQPQQQPQQRQQLPMQQMQNAAYMPGNGPAYSQNSSMQQQPYAPMAQYGQALYQPYGYGHAPMYNQQAQQLGSMQGQLHPGNPGYGQQPRVAEVDHEAKDVAEDTDLDGEDFMNPNAATLETYQVHAQHACCYILQTQVD